MRITSAALIVFRSTNSTSSGIPKGLVGCLDRAKRFIIKATETVSKSPMPPETPPITQCNGDPDGGKTVEVASVAVNGS